MNDYELFKYLAKEFNANEHYNEGRKYKATKNGVHTVTSMGVDLRNPIVSIKNGLLISNFSFLRKYIEGEETRSSTRRWPHFKIETVTIKK